MANEATPREVGSNGPVRPAAEARAHELKLLVDLRWALGDFGKRMQPEFVQYAARIKTERDTAMEVLRQIAAAKRRTREQRLASSCLGLLDSLRDEA